MGIKDSINNFFRKGNKNTDGASHETSDILETEIIPSTPFDSHEAIQEADSASLQKRLRELTDEQGSPLTTDYLGAGETLPEARVIQNELDERTWRQIQQEEESLPEQTTPPPAPPTPSKERGSAGETDEPLTSEGQREIDGDNPYLDTNETEAPTTNTNDAPAEGTGEKRFGKNSKGPETVELENGMEIEKNAKGGFPFNKTAGKLVQDRRILVELAGKDIPWAKDALADYDSKSAPSFVLPAKPQEQGAVPKKPLPSADKVAEAFNELSDEPEAKSSPKGSPAERARAKGEKGVAHLKQRREEKLKKEAQEKGVDNNLWDRINRQVDKIPAPARIAIGIALVAAIGLAGPTWAAAPFLLAKTFLTAASFDRLWRHHKEKFNDPTFKDADAMGQLAVTLFGAGILVFSLLSGFEDVGEMVSGAFSESSEAASNAITEASVSTGSILAPDITPPIVSPEDITGGYDISAVTAPLAHATDAEILSVADNTPPPVVTGADIGIPSSVDLGNIESVAPSATEITPLPDSSEVTGELNVSGEALAPAPEGVNAVAGSATQDISGAEIGEVTVPETPLETPTEIPAEEAATPEVQAEAPAEGGALAESASAEELSAESVAEQIGAGATPETAPDAQVESLSPSIEVPADISVVARPGDGAITMLMHWAEAAEGTSFEEGSFMAELVEAQEQGGLYEVAQRIAMEQGLYQPDAIAESFNVHVGATLETTNVDGVVSFTLANPDGESYSLWSSVTPEAPAYDGDNMIDTLPNGAEKVIDESTATPRSYTPEQAIKLDEANAWPSGPLPESPVIETPVSTPEVTTPTETPEPQTAAGEEIKELQESKTEQITAMPSNDDVVPVDPDPSATAQEEVEQTFASQADLLNLTSESWAKISALPIPQIFTDLSSTASERAQELVELAGEHGIALHPDSAGELEYKITMMHSAEGGTYGEVALTNDGEMRTIEDVYREGIRNSHQ